MNHVILNEAHSTLLRACLELAERINSRNEESLHSPSCLSEIKSYQVLAVANYKVLA